MGKPTAKVELLEIPEPSTMRLSLTRRTFSILTLILVFAIGSYVGMQGLQKVFAAEGEIWTGSVKDVFTESPHDGALIEVALNGCESGYANISSSTDAEGIFALEYDAFLALLTSNSCGEGDQVLIFVLPSSVDYQSVRVTDINIDFSDFDAETLEEWAEGYFAWLLSEYDGHEFFILPKFAGGSGLLYDPYEIETALQFRVIGEMDTTDLYFVLNDDISLSAEYETISTFAGHLDGQGHTIDGITVPLFDAIEDGSITDIALDGVIVTTESQVGLLASTVSGVSIEDVTVSGTLTVSAFESGACEHIGGLVGYSLESSYENITSSVDVTAPECIQVGGVLGSSETDRLVNIIVSGDVTGHNEVGGVMGFYFGFVESSDGIGLYHVAVTGEVSGNSRIGGLIGFVRNGNVGNATVSGEVMGDDKVGGLVGEGRSSTNEFNYISFARVLGDVSGGNNTGGIVGYLVADPRGGWQLYLVYSDNTVSGSNDVGGLVGTAEAQSDSPDDGLVMIDNAYSWASVTAEGDNAGGLIGRLKSAGESSGGYSFQIQLMNTYAWNKHDGAGVSAAANAGGLLGYLEDTNGDSEGYMLLSSFAQTPVSTSGNTAGGLLGVRAGAPSDFVMGTDNYLNYFNTTVASLIYCDSVELSLCAVVTDEDYFFDTEENPPMHMWHFDDVWLAQSNTPPVFQAQFIDGEFGPTEREDDESPLALHGYVLDTETDDSIPFASINLRCEEGGTVVTQADETGAYSFTQADLYDAIDYNCAAALNIALYASAAGYAEGDEEWSREKVSDISWQGWLEINFDGSSFNFHLTATEDGDDEPTDPAIISFSPADNATNVAKSANLSFAFNEEVGQGEGSVYIYRADGELFKSFWYEDEELSTTDGITYTVNPTSDFEPGTSYYVLIADDAFWSVSRDTYFPGISDPTTWNFTIASGSTGGGGGGSSRSRSRTNTDTPSTDTTGGDTETPGTPSCSLALYPTQAIRMGAPNDPAQVRLLEQFLNEFEHANLPVDGIYDAADEAFVKKWQEKYASEILAPWGETSGTGYVFTTSLNKIKSVFLARCAAPTMTPTTPSTVRDVTVGMSGDDVRALQTLLIGQGYAIPAGATGFFAGQTQAALAAYQAAHGITPSVGYFGEKTRAQMKGAGLGVWW